MQGKQKRGKKIGGVQATRRNQADGPTKKGRGTTVMAVANRGRRNAPRFNVNLKRRFRPQVIVPANSQRLARNIVKVRFIS